MTDYRPIDCARYSEYELAILHAQRLRLSWLDGGGTPHTGVILPVDLQTRHHEEFLVGLDNEGARVEIRLDRIRQSAPA